MIRLSGESRYVTLGAVRAHYVVKGQGPPLLLFHGLGASVVAWRDNIGPLSDSFRVYAVDLPGHGDSGKPDIEYAPAEMVRFVAEFVHTLGLGRPAMAGNSVGGALGLMTAIRHPEIVSHLVLVASAALGTEVSGLLRLMAVPGLGDLLARSRAAAVRFYRREIFCDRALATQELVDELCRTRFMPGAPRAVTRLLRAGVGLRGVRGKFVLLDGLASLKIPVMVVWGAQDRVLPVAHAYRDLEAAPRARLQVFDRCGHWPQMEKASEFNSRVLEFVAA